MSINNSTNEGYISESSYDDFPDIFNTKPSNQTSKKTYTLIEQMAYGFDLEKRQSTQQPVTIQTVVPMPPNPEQTEIQTVVPVPPRPSTSVSSDNIPPAPAPRSNWISKIVSLVLSFIRWSDQANPFAQFFHRQ